MAAADKNFQIEAGADFQVELIWKDADGDVKDLSGYTAQMQLRQYEDADDVFLELSTDNGRITIDGPAGRIILAVTAADTAGLASCDTVYDLFLTAPSPSGVVTKLLKGGFSIDGAVTR